LTNYNELGIMCQGRIVNNAKMATKDGVYETGTCFFKQR